MLKGNINTQPKTLNGKKRINDLMIVYRGKNGHIP
jgi:hypothetical protein